MLVETEKVEHIATVAASFDWSWTEEDLIPLCDALGWTGVVSRTKRTATLRTDLSAAQSQAYWRAWDQGGIGELIMVVTDQVNANDGAAMQLLRGEYDTLVARLETVLGPPHTIQRGPEPKARWDRNNLVLRLYVLRGYINLYLVNPAYQEWIDTPDDFAAY
ncbi:DUF6301 family protein [Nocardia sp. NPDC056000]|uniref:DUF6301 family protein n=1 Tax=Nocardia sp. NPDC056000 TaxID=3345674 RepID=UPI0035DCB680